MPEAVLAGPRTALAVRGLSKTYAGTLALDSLFMQIRPGEIHALLGGNGSGKSTTIKILAGVVPADPGGEISVGDDVVGVSEWTSGRAHAAGLRFVHQQPAVFPELTIAENLAIGSGFPRGVGKRIDWKALNDRTAALLAKYHINASPRTPLIALRAADRARVAIVRALQDMDDASHGILVLDEPTAALPGAEVDELLQTLRGYSAAGLSILYVSHRLDEVLSVADRVTVLRDGRKVDTVEAEGLTEADLIELIVGKPLDRVFPAAPIEDANTDAAMVVRGLRGGPLTGVDLTLRKGEVLGIAGLLGSGRSELLRMLFGAYPIEGGSVTLEGSDYRPKAPDEAMKAGVAYVPEDRQADALLLGESVRHNLSAGQARSYFQKLLFRHGAEKSDSTRSISDFLIRVRGDQQPIETLSGGNQQKVVMARWLRRRPKVLLLDEPTQGVDVGARQEIYQLIRKATAQGTSVILVVSEPEELAHASDRVAVLRGGRITTVVERPVDAHKLTELMNIEGATASEGKQ